MINLMDYPLIIFVISMLVLWLSAKVGVLLRTKKALDEDTREDFDLILASTLTLLGLIIGFTFSMATGRYDQRKNYEEEEANAIGTEYLRADLLPVADAAKAKRLLTTYVDQRILFYTTRNVDQLHQINADTAQLQAQLWSTVQAPVAAQPTPVAAVVASGMNDVLNSQGYTQAAWWNRIPVAAWCLMGTIAICANVLMGYKVRNSKVAVVLLILPLTVSVALFLIAEIDSPRSGIIRVIPQNLISLSQSLQGH